MLLTTQKNNYIFARFLHIRKKNTFFSAKLSEQEISSLVTIFEKYKGEKYEKRT
jgi:hypothetical protein